MYNASKNGWKLNHFDETKSMSFFIKNKKLFQKYNEIWDEVSNSIIKRFDSDPFYSEKYLKTKLKSYAGKINTNFHDN